MTNYKTEIVCRKATSCPHFGTEACRPLSIKPTISICRNQSSYSDKNRLRLGVALRKENMTLILGRTGVFDVSDLVNGDTIFSWKCNVPGSAMGNLEISATIANQNV